jgi:hypothetical protein
MRGFGRDGAGGCANEQPFGCPADSVDQRSSFGGLCCGIPLLGQRGGLCPFVGEVLLGGVELGFALLAVYGEIIKGLQVFCRQDDSR